MHKLLGGLVFLTSIANAGTFGTQAVVCRDGNRQVRSAEILDLYEARVFYGQTLTTWDPARTDRDIKQSAAQNIGRGGAGEPEADGYPFVRSDSGKNLLYIDPNSETDHNSFALDVAIITGNDPYFLTKLAAGNHLTLTDDAAPLVQPEGCAIEQVLTAFSTSAKIFRDEEIYAHLDPANRAAMDVDRVLALRMRERGDGDARRARRIVGMAFSGYVFHPLAEGLGDPLIYCQSSGQVPDYRFVAYRTGPKVTLQFFTYNGFVSSSKSTIVTGAQASPFADLANGGGMTSTPRWAVPNDLESAVSIETEVTSAGLQITMGAPGYDKGLGLARTPVTCMPVAVATNAKAP